MANSVKLNSKESMTKSDKLARKNVIRRAKQADNSLLKPSKTLNKFGRAMFRSIKENSTLQNSDNYLLNLLCSEYQLYIKMTNYISKHGVVDSKGKKSAEFQIYKATIDQILKLSSQLNLTPKNRINAEYQQETKQDSADPVVQALKGSGDNE